MTHYATPPGGLPPQSQLLSGRAIFTTAYAVIPKGVMTDIVTSYLPHWEGTRAWVIARPLSGFAETFSQYVMEVAPGGGSEKPEGDPRAEGVIFVVSGVLTLTVGRAEHVMEAGGYAYLPAGATFTVKNRGSAAAVFHWVRKAYEAVEGIPAPKAFVTREQDVPLSPMPDTDGRWATQRFVDPADLSHDMHVNIVNLEAGAVIPFAETHVMEHGLYVLEGQGRLPAERRLGGGRGGGLHVAPRLLPAGLLCGRAGAVPVSALQGREPARAARVVLRGRARSAREADAPAARLASGRGLAAAPFASGGSIWAEMKPKVLRAVPRRGWRRACPPRGGPRPPGRRGGRG